MTLLIRPGIWGIASILLITACTTSNRHSPLIVATAANMQFAMEEIALAFTDETGIDCKLVVSSSGKLTAQISEGAPFDVFVAANMKYPAEIERQGIALEPPRVYAYGKLVLWSMRGDINPSLGMLENDSIRHIAIATPKTAPYGEAAIEALNSLDLLEVIESKLVYGESIAQVNQFIMSGAAEVGFTAMAVVLSPEMEGKGRWQEVDPSSYSRIDQGIVLIKRDNGQPGQARAFQDFLLSPRAQTILVNFGYSTVE